MNFEAELKITKDEKSINLGQGSVTIDSKVI